MAKLRLPSQRRFRTLLVEQFERRQLLASDVLYLDVNHDRMVSPGDVLAIVNAINSQEAYAIDNDVNRDHLVTPQDVLLVVDAINAGVSTVNALSEPASIDAVDDNVSLATVLRVADTSIESLVGGNLKNNAGATIGMANNLSNSNLAPGPFGNAVRITQPNHYAAIAHTAALDALGANNSDFSLSFWLGTDQVFDGSYRLILHKGSSSQQNGPSIYMRPGDNRLQVRLSTQNNVSEVFDSQSALVVGAWTQVTLVKQGLQCSLYLNGQLDNQFTLSSATVGNTAPLYFGGAPFQAGGAASFDELEVFNRALTKPEIQLLQTQPQQAYQVAEGNVGTNDTSTSVPLTFSAVSVAPAGVLDLASDGSFAFVVTGQPASVLFTYQATDPIGGFDQANGIQGTDTSPPSTVSFTRSNPTTATTSADKLEFLVTFSEAVINVNAGDFAVDGSTTAVVSNVVNISASRYIVTVSGGDLAGFNGRVGLSLAAGQNITDLANNPLPTTEPALDEAYTVANLSGVVDAVDDNVSLATVLRVADTSIESLVGGNLKNNAGATIGMANNLSNSNLAPGPFGNAVRITQPNHYAAIAHTAALDALGANNSDFSLSFWLGTDQVFDGSYRLILHKGSSSQQNGPSIYMRPGDNRLQVRLSTQNNVSEVFDSQSALVVGAWTQVTLVKQGLQCSLYLNGQLDNQFTLSSATVGNTAPLYFGGAPFQAGGAASFDELEVFNRALTKPEIQLLQTQPQQAYQVAEGNVGTNDTSTSVPLTFSAVSVAPAGVLDLASDGSFAFVVTGQPASVLFTYQATDPIGGFDQANGVLVNQNQSGSIGLTSNNINVNENAGIVTIGVSRVNGSGGIVTVDYRTEQGSAIDGTDYVGGSGTLTFLDGETYKTVDFPIIDDALFETNELFNFTIDNVLGGATLLAPRTASIAILDDDTPLPNYPSFPNANGLNLVADSSVVDNQLQLTVAQPNQTSAVFFNHPLPIDESSSFQTSFRFVVSNEAVGGTGFTFMAQNSPQGLAALGTGSAGLGYNQIPNSVAVAFQTVQDGGLTAPNLVSLLRDGNLPNPVVSLPSFPFNSGTLITAWVDYNGTSDQLAVYLSQDEVKPSEPLFVAKVDLFAQVGNQAYLGFSGATGLDPHQHRIQSWSFTTAVPHIPFTTTSVTDVPVVVGLNQPTAIDWTDGGQNMLIAQKDGVVRVFRGGNLLQAPFIDISSMVNSNFTVDRGLIGIAVHPDFYNYPYVYLSFTYDPPEVYANTGMAGPDGNGNRAARVLRVEANPATNYTTAVAGSEFVILGTNSTWEHFNAFVDSTVNFNEPAGGYNPDGSNVRDFVNSDSISHTIGELVFGPDGALYVSTGDGASFNQVDPRGVRVQDVDNLSGKILRIDPISGDGLPDNPFYSESDPTANRSKVFQYGLRNPFRFAIDQLNGKVFVGDVGWTKWEEINQGTRGANFGWPYYEGGNGVNLQNDPYAYLPSAQAFYASGQYVTPSLLGYSHAGDGAVAIVVGDVYRGTVYPSQFQGDLFINDISLGIVRNVSFDANGAIEAVGVFTTDAFYAVQILTGPDGYLYYVSLTGNRVGRWEIN